MSTEADSGWRELDDDRIAELVGLFTNGDSGATTLAIPSLLAGPDGAPTLSRIDGRARLNNGKWAIAALKVLQKEAAEAPPAAGGFAPPPHGAGGPAPPPDGAGGPAPPERLAGSLLLALTTQWFGSTSCATTHGKRRNGGGLQRAPTRLGPEQVRPDVAGDEGRPPPPPDHRTRNLRVTQVPIPKAWIIRRTRAPNKKKCRCNHHNRIVMLLVVART